MKELRRMTGGGTNHLLLFTTFMQQFLVPQFIDVEDKIIGPITTRQFIELLFMALIDFIAYKLADFSLFLFIAIINLALFGTLAFFKVNGQPFHYFLLNLIQTLKKPKLRVWNKIVTEAELARRIKEVEVKAPPRITPRRIISTSRLSELALIADTGGVYKGEE